MRHTFSTSMRRRACRDHGISMASYESPFFELQSTGLTDLYDFKGVFDMTEQAVLKHGGERELMTHADEFCIEMTKAVKSHPMYAKWLALPVAGPRRRARKAITMEDVGTTLWRIDLRKASYYSIAIPFPEIVKYSSSYEEWASNFSSTKYVTSSKRIRNIVSGSLSPTHMQALQRDVVERIIDVCIENGYSGGLLSVMHDEAILLAPPPENIQELALAAGIRHPFRVQQVDVCALETPKRKFMYLIVDDGVKLFSVPSHYVPQVWKAIHKKQIYDHDLYFNFEDEAVRFDRDIFGLIPPPQMDDIAYDGEADSDFVPFLDRLTPAQREGFMSKMDALRERFLKERKEEKKMDDVDKFQEELSGMVSELRMLDMHAEEEISLADRLAGGEPGRIFITSRQADIFRKFMDLMVRTNFRLKLGKCRSIGNSDTPVVRKPLFGASIGDPVLVRPCGKEYGGKTYFGFMVGDVATTASIRIEEDKVVSEFCGHNPAILVPSLGKVIFGCESWWSKIKSEEDLDKVITDETIENCWYVQVLKRMYGKKEESKNDL